MVSVPAGRSCGPFARPLCENRAELQGGGVPVTLHLMPWPWCQSSTPACISPPSGSPSLTAERLHMALGGFSITLGLTSLLCEMGTA